MILSVLYTLKKKKRKKKRPFGQCVWQRETHGEELKQESHLAIVRKTQVRASGGQFEKIERNIVRV